MNKLLMVEKYRKMGWSVIPIKTGDKTPVNKWAEYQTRHATDDEVKEWWGNGKDYNVGVVTGAISNLGVVDADGETGIRTITSLGLTSPYTSLTGSGRQLFYRFGDNHNTCKTLDGVDTRGEGGYVVVPPSTHPNGMPYRWANPLPPIDMLPSWPSEVLAGQQESLVKAIGPIKAQSILDLLTHGCVSGVNGGRHPTLIKLACYLIPRHSFDMTKHLLMEWNKLNSPPYSEADIEKQIVDLSKRYAKGEYKTKYVAPMERMPIEISSAKEGMDECIKNLSSSKAATIDMPMGFTSLDSVTLGLKRGGVLVVGARPGIGKTSFCVQIASLIAMNNKTVLYFSTELTAQEIAEKQLSEVGGIDAFALASKVLTPEQQAQAVAIATSISSYPFHTVKAFKPDIKTVREAIEQINPDAIIFDHIQHIASGDKQYSDIDGFVKSLKALALEKNLAVVICSQLSRRHEIEGRLPELVDLKECGTLEEEASVVILMHDAQKKGNRPILFRVAKNRHGKCGDTTLLFECNYTRFVDMGVEIG